jgi:hypothetical protein
MKRSPFLLLSRLGILLSCFASSGLAQSIKPGTEVKVRLLENLNTGEAKEGQTFLVTLAEPVKLENGKVMARGVQMNGLVTEAVSSGRLKRPASITLTLTRAGNILIHSEALQIDGKSHMVRNAALVGGGAATGAVLGAISGGGKGAVIGTAFGAGAGTGTAFVTGKQEIVLQPETELTFVVAGRTGAVTRAPEAIVEKNAERAPESRPAHWREASNEQRDDAYDALIFSERDKWLIHNYFQSNYGNLPPGLAKRDGDLPPGLEKQLRREGSLPPGLQKRMEPLPGELDRQLPRLPLGYSRMVLSGRVMILAGDGEIVDLMFIYR